MMRQQAPKPLNNTAQKPICMLQERDFIELDYTGTTEGTVFDTTSMKVAKEHGLPDKGLKPAVVCLGEFGIITALAKELIGKEPGKDYTITLQDAFGKKSAAAIRMVPASAFRRDKVVPQPGMQITVDGQMGTIMTARGGRFMVDFNHPLASRIVSYQVKVNKVLSEPSQKVKVVIEHALGTEIPAVEMDGETARVVLPVDLPKELHGPLEAKAKELCGVSAVTFTKVEKKEEKVEKKSADGKETGTA